jgi:hypothetical protein
MQEEDNDDFNMDDILSDDEAGLGEVQHRAPVRQQGQRPVERVAAAAAAAAEECVAGPPVPLIGFMGGPAGPARPQAVGLQLDALWPPAWPRRGGGLAGGRAGGRACGRTCGKGCWKGPGQVQALLRLELGRLQLGTVVCRYTVTLVSLSSCIRCSRLCLRSLAAGPTEAPQAAAGWCVREWAVHNQVFGDGVVHCATGVRPGHSVVQASCGTRAFLSIHASDAGQVHALLIFQLDGEQDRCCSCVQSASDAGQVQG